MPSLHRDWLTAAALFAVTGAVFLPALQCVFVTYDDPEYVLANPHVRNGLNLADARWAFGTFHASNWHPLTWLSLQLDATVWRSPQGAPEPWGFHLTNLLLHAANAAVLFLALRALTGTYGLAVAAALLFAVHPLRVESVAWVAERKDVLSVFFGLLALRGYAAYARAPSVGRYLAVAAAFALSLCSKPALVALPALFLVLDWWPCGRVRTRRDWFRLALEKVPLLLISLISCAVTFVAQARGGATRNLENYSLGVRAANAAVSYVAYPGKTLWPFDLAVFYPHPGALLPAWKVAVSVLFLALVTAVALALRRRAPYLLAGWLWYVGMLVPVLGLVQVGNQAYADRYSYFPQVGILVAVCWAVADILAGRSAVALVATGVVAAALVIRTEDQLRSWRNSATLWQHDVDVAGENSTALTSLGALAADEGHFGQAETYYRRALELDDANLFVHLNLGTMLAGQKRLDEAAPHLERACELAPESALPHLHLGHLLLDRGQLDRAERELQLAATLAPAVGEAYWHLARLSVKRGQWERAVDYYRETLRCQPDYPDAHYWLARALFRTGQTAECAGELREQVRLNPRSADAHLLLAQVSETLGDREGAARHFEAVTRLDPRRLEAWYGLGTARALQGRAAEYERQLTLAIRHEPASVPYRVALAGVLHVVAAAQAAEGHPSDAAATERRAKDLVAAAGRPDLLRRIEEKLQSYERGENGRPAAGEAR